MKITFVIILDGFAGKILKLILTQKVVGFCYQSPVLETRPNKITHVWPLASHHTNHLSKTEKTC